MRHSYRKTQSWGWIVAIALCLPGYASAQDNNQPQPPCQLDYRVNIVTLVTNDDQMYWNQSDCIRVLVTNNPFIFKYT